tara:strand:+ start:4150 stop:5145 length:996 start_codon:yes stop_codon:yes gene_type:complete
MISSLIAGSELTRTDNLLSLSANALEITSDDNSALAMPILSLYKDSSISTAGDIIGGVRFFGNNGTSKKFFGGITCEVKQFWNNNSGSGSPSDSEETGKISFKMPRGDGWVSDGIPSAVITDVTGTIPGVSNAGTYDHEIMFLDETGVTVKGQNGLRVYTGEAYTLQLGNIKFQPDGSNAGTIVVPNSNGMMVVGQRDSNGNVYLTDSIINGIEATPTTFLITDAQTSYSMTRNRKYINSYETAANTFVLPTLSTTGQMITVINASSTQNLNVDRNTNSLSVRAANAGSGLTQINTNNVTIAKGGVAEFVYVGTVGQSDADEVVVYGSGVS